MATDVLLRGGTFDLFFLGTQTSSSDSSHLVSNLSFDFCCPYMCLVPGEYTGILAKIFTQKLLKVCHCSLIVLQTAGTKKKKKKKKSFLNTRNGFKIRIEFY